MSLTDKISLWSMVAAWFSAIVTLVAAVAAIWALKGWKKQEEAKELKNLRVSVYKYNASLIFAPELINKQLSDEELNSTKKVYDALQDIYIATLMMHDRNTRGGASSIYSSICNIHDKYTKGEITNKVAHDKVMKVRNSEPLLGVCS